jgi:hypothetical protein
MLVVLEVPAPCGSMERIMLVAEAVIHTARYRQVILQVDQAAAVLVETIHKVELRLVVLPILVVAVGLDMQDQLADLVLS